MPQTHFITLEARVDIKGAGLCTRKIVVNTNAITCFFPELRILHINNYASEITLTQESANLLFQRLQSKTEEGWL